MFKRETLTTDSEEQKKREYIRQRNVLLNFRVSEEEKEKIEKRIELSGLTKQDFLIQSLMNQKVVCIGSAKSFDVIKKQLFIIEKHIKDLAEKGELDETILESLRMILELYQGLNKPID